MQNDYISREALVKELMTRDFYPAIVRRAIEAIPAADVRPVVHGKWVERTHDDGFGEYKLLHCSACDTATVPTPERKPYCFGCGAVMDGGRNG